MDFSPPPSLETLPFSILCQICEYLPLLDLDRASLFSFSLASKRCSQASVGERFSHVTFTITSAARLESDIARARKTLSDAHAYAYLRQVTIIVHTELCPDSNYGDQLGDFDRRDEAVRRREREEVIEASGWDPQHNRFFSPQLCLPQSADILCRCQKAHDRDEDAKIWQPLVGLLGRIPRLTDLVVERMPWLPRSILHSLHEKHPSCRLHMHAFSLRSQYCVKHHPNTIDDDEYLLITSPCLYSIITSYSCNYVGETVDYNGEALIAMLSRYSPSLRHLWAERRFLRSERGLTENLRTPRPPWSGFFPGGQRNCQDANYQPSRTGNLKSIILSGHKIAIHDYIHANDFSQVSSLHLEGFVKVDVDTLRPLLKLEQRGGLRSLRSLGLGLCGNVELQTEELACELLGRVPPLQYFALKTSNDPDRILKAVFTRHGPTLRTLCIQGANASSACVENLQSHCQRLEQLMITLPRRPGDEHEVDVYRTLGRLPELKRLSIWLSFPPPTQEVADFDFMNNHSDEECVDYIRKSMPLFAVDADLAKSMFRTVAAQQRARAGASSLQRLCLRPLSTWSQYSDASELTGPTFQDAAEWIARSWVCRPCRWSDRPSDVKEQAGMENPSVTAERCFVSVNEEHTKGEMEEMMWDGITGIAWKAVWPNPGDDWLESWSSIPMLGSA